MDNRPELNITLLIHTFPLYSLTFIVDEIDELRRQGCGITPFSIRKPTPDEYPPAFQRFHDETRYLFPINKWAFCWRHITVFWQHPVGYFRALSYLLSRPSLSLTEKLKSLVYFAEAIYCYPLLKQSGCRHLHVHFMFGGAVMALVLHKLCGLTYSMTAHGTDFLVKNQLLAEKIAHAAFVRVGTQFNADYLQAMIGETAAAKLFVLPFGIDVAMQPKPPLRTPNRPPKIVNIGRLVWQKGQLLLLAAVAKLRDEGHDFSLDIIGEGEMRAELEQAILSQGLGGVVNLCGALPRGEVMEQLANADIFVFSSVSEGFGIVLLEAMLSGVAIVAPRLNGIPEIIEHDRSGKLFDVGDVAAMAANIEALLIDPGLRQTLTENAARAVREQFDQREKIAVLLKKFQENYH